jgi:chromosome segregation ATPase
MEDLQGLAKLCLCRDWHYSQWNEVSLRWKPIVILATKQFERLNPQTQLNQTGVVDAERFKKLLLERQRCFELLGIKVGTENVDLFGTLTSYHLSTGTKMRENETIIIQLRSGLSSSQDQLRAANEEVKHAKLRQTQLTVSHSAALAHLEENRKSENARLAELQKVSDATKDEQKRLEIRLSIIENDLGTVNRLLSEEKVKTRNGEEAKRDLQRQLVEAKANAESSATQADKASQDNEALIKTHAAARDQINQLQTDLSAARDQSHRLENDLGTVNGLLSEVKIKTRDGEEVKRDLQRQLVEAKANAASSATQADKASRDNEALIKTHAAARDQINHLQTELSAAEDQNHRLENDRSVMARALQQFQADIQAIQQANEQLTMDKSLLQGRITAREVDESKRWRHRLRTWMSKLHTVS